MRRIRTKLILSLLAAVLLPVLPSYYIVKKIISINMESYININVETAIEEAAGISRILRLKYRDEIKSVAVELANSNEIIHFIQNRTLAPPNLTKYAKSIEPVKMDIYDARLNLVLSDSISTGTPFPPWDKHIINQLLQKSDPGFLEEGIPVQYLYAYAPIKSYGKNIGIAAVIHVLNENFIRSVNQILQINQMFKTFDFFGSAFQGSYLLLFFAVYGPIVLISIGVGYFISHRITSPLLKLARGTRVVADGNLDYQMEVSSKDEIGQLLTAFNKMIVTIKEKQRIAQEQEAQRIRMEEEALRKAKDLEMSELKTRALQAENERKAIELEKAQELEKAYQALEESYRHLRETQAQLVQSGKMASLGNLAAGVAHEINNPLGAINSAADVAMRAIEKINTALKNDETAETMKKNKQFMNTLQILQENTELIVMGSSRVVKIVRSLKTFARLDEAEFQTVDIHEGIDSTLTLLQHELKNRITVEKEYGNIPSVVCYPNELNQVFMNLLANAAQAIEDKGIIYIRTSTKKNQVIIQIEDTGHGIPKENLGQIFDPGFTTRGVGVGTGLGLSISYKIIQKHKGEIDVLSHVGKGSTFTLSLPMDLDRQIDS